MLTPRGSTVTSQDPHWLAFKDVLSGTSNAMVGDAATLMFYVNQHKDHKLSVNVPADLPKERYAFLVGKGNTALQQKLNAGLAAVRADGTYARLYQKWFNSAKI
ncbi:transporter substrate-binding domain-containing protein [Kingella negevensis]|uniref:transporter substrate-binding domain-containing protein n=1 Tax=Kingella negevensis TaxID=1522312 RepID=UPI001FD769D6|nr:transporter substrate-binding domain-containing protein [Kingella negevensis]MDK4687976.1 transporter substrate-binding domain-containing protein [Kingella negevensis]WII92180.1 transporter substrate-binding domain-containing protein [Kingella negevensis]